MGTASVRPSWAGSPLRLILLGASLEAVYLVGFVRPYGLLAWLPSPAQDLGSLSEASAPSAVAYLGSVAVLVVGGILAYREACRLPSRLAVPIALGFAGLFAATLVWIYPIDALDVFDYAMHGRMLALLGANPYIALPAWFPDDPFLPSVGWKTYPSVYGPLWTYVEGAVAWLSGDNLLMAVLLFKGIAAASSLACAWSAYRIACRWTSRPAAGASVLVGWNPLVVLMAGSGHNDLLMMALFLGGVWLLAEDRGAAGLWLAGVSSLIKAATVPLVLLVVIGQIIHLRRTRGSVVRGVVLPLTGLVVVAAALYAPFWAGPDTLGPLMLAGLFSQSPLALVRELGTPDLGEPTATEMAARLGDALVVVIVAVAAWRMYRQQRLSAEALADASFWIVFLALGWWQPWYVAWFACLAAVDERPWVRGLSWIAGWAGLVALFDRFYLTQHWLVVDGLTHQVHTCLLIFLPPIAWACVAPLVRVSREPQPGVDRVLAGRARSALGTTTTNPEAA